MQSKNLEISHSFLLPSGKRVSFATAPGFYPVNSYQSELLALRAIDQAYALAAEKTDGSLRRLRAAEWCAGNAPAAIVLKVLGVGTVAASDINPKALEIAQYNAELNGVQIDHFLVSDVALIDNPSSPGDRFDLIAVNPPCGPAGVVPQTASADLRRAVDGGKSGSDYFTKVVEAAPQHLTDDGRLVIVLTSTMNIPKAIGSLNASFGSNWFAAPSTPVLAPLPDTLPSDPRGQRFLATAEEGETIAYAAGDQVNRLTWILVASKKPLSQPLSLEQRFPMAPYGQPKSPVNALLQTLISRVSAKFVQLDI